MRQKKTKQVFCYCDHSETIRTLPANYLVAYRRDGRWVCDPDLAVPKRMAVRCFKALLSHDLKYGSWVELLAAITPFTIVD